MSRLLFGSVLSVVLATVSQAQAQQRSFDVPSEPAVLAIPEFARQADLQIVAPADKLTGIVTTAIKGELEVHEALRQLLAGTPLEVTSEDGPIITLQLKIGYSNQKENTTARTKTSDNGGLGLDEIVVTGTSVKQEKFTAPYAISTMNSDQIQREAPSSTVDLLKSVPGIWAESSGGAGGGENVYVRGLPGGSFQYMGLMEDGLPLFETNYESYMNIDELYRIDLGTERAEVVRGGTAPIFTNNAPGGVVNFITNHGTETPESVARMTVGSAGLARGDAVVSGPITDKLLLSLSAFGRRDDGLRDAGFSNADQGGQVKIGGTYKFDGGKIFADLKYLNDHSIFYTDIPITNPLDGSKLDSVINPNYGTLDSNYFRHVTLMTLSPGGGLTSVNRDLADGIHPQVKTFTLGGDYDLGNEWVMSDKFRYTDGMVGFDELANGSFGANSSGVPINAQAYANQLAGQGYTGRFVIAGTNTPAAIPGNLVMNNIWSSVRTSYTDAINDLKFDKLIDSKAYGRHDVTVGTYYSHYTFEQNRMFGNMLTTINSQPYALDLQRIDSSGKVLGNLTYNGFTSFTAGASGSLSGDAVAFYGSENWHITKDWQADIGARGEIEYEAGLRGNITSQSVMLPGVIAPITVQGVTSYTAIGETLRGSAWTAGSSYQVLKPLNAFVRYTNSYSMPRFQNIYNAGATFNGKPLPVTNIEQAEGGVKVSVPTFQLYAVGFWSKFDPLIQTVLVQPVAGGSLVTQTVSAVTNTVGTEIEASWRPYDFFDLTGNLTIQDARLSDVQTNSGASGVTADGKQVARVPSFMMRVEPAYLFHVNDDVRVRLFTTISAIGDRYQDYTNLSLLKGYQTIDAGVVVTCANGLDFELKGTNLTNAVGLTEGNARLGPVQSGTAVTDASIGRPIFGRAFTLSTTMRW